VFVDRAIDHASVVPDDVVLHLFLNVLSERSLLYMLEALCDRGFGGRARHAVDDFDTAKPVAWRLLLGDVCWRRVEDMVKVYMEGETFQFSKKVGICSKLLLSTLALLSNTEPLEGLMLLV
jgi:hypothetical protein